MKHIAWLFCILMSVGLLSGCNAQNGGLFGQLDQTQAHMNTQTPDTTADVQTVQDEAMTLYLAFGERDGVYTGELQNGLPDGEGSFVTANSDGVSWTYQGEWINGHMNGSGQTLWEDGWSVQGTYVDDCITKGATYHDGVLRYSGEYACDIYNGDGATYDAAGDVIFDGEFHNGYLMESEEDRITRADCIAPIANIPTVADYEGCLINPDAYIGMKVVIAGSVVYRWDPDQEDPAYAEFVVAQDGDEYYPIDVFYRYAWEEPTVEEGEWLTCYGVFAGIYTYTGDDGNEYSMPVVQAHVVYHEEYFQ